MEPGTTLTISTLRALIVLADMEEKRLSAILDDATAPVEWRSEALDDLEKVLGAHRVLTAKLAEIEPRQ